MRKYLVMTLAAAALTFPNSGRAELGRVDELKLALNMYSAQRAWRIGDLLTVRISESTRSSKTEDFKTSKQARAAAEAPIFGISPAKGMEWIGKAFNRDNPLPSYEVQAASSFDGSGSTSSTESLVTSFTVRVVDVHDNGNLVVRGDRKLIIRNESVNMVVTGLVRARDISRDNAIASSQLADAHIYYETQGEVSRGSRPGLVWRVFQFVNPF